MADTKRARVTVEIYGQTYTVVGTEPSSHVRYVASLVDEKMREISKHNRHLDSKRIAVLTAVNNVHEFLKLQERVKELEDEVKKLKG
ncbi:cell division protein ZapA [Sporosarcina sp. P21c]|uniref:cell division protein ZapA n=1 Tax=Sporosarcina TaxID=1569 RepID=UPI000A16541C|nr:MULTISPECIES: cell division protein ZapA [Sporosarcina]ARJ37942.1 cell division protein ZapA [Sporosarcina ureae]PIC67744.1 cell division protein ZapA [Sporosarcina sp. P16a]PIC83737.1 cell division protein ZapA [Sporosarcina sp. P1]PIC90603.1 cell division protein ZapA [Sporosarcina sp. P21c]PIC93369.1 cell division protein ZapA [Sporosarcina sp. P25]